MAKKPNAASNPMPAPQPKQGGKKGSPMPKPGMSGKGGKKGGKGC